LPSIGQPPVSSSISRCRKAAANLCGAKGTVAAAFVGVLEGDARHHPRGRSQDLLLAVIATREECAVMTAMVGFLRRKANCASRLRRGIKNRKIAAIAYGIPENIGLR